MTLTADDRLAVADLVTDFFACLDSRQPAGLARLFAAGASLDMGIAGRPVVEGRDAIVAAFSDPRPGRETRHLWSSLKIVPDGDGASAAFQVMVYAREGGQDPAAIAHLCDTELGLARDAEDGGWRFTSMKRTVAFAFR